jgi:hypothetical protein
MNNKKNNIEIDLWQPLLAQSFSKDDLIEEIDEFINLCEKKREANFSKTLDMLEVLESYFKNLEKGLDKDFKDEFVKDLIDIYTRPSNKKFLHSSQRKVLKNYINFILIALKTRPIDKEGNHMGKKRIKKWLREVYLKHNKDITKIRKYKIKKETLEEKKRWDKVKEILSPSVLWNYFLNEIEKEDLLEIMTVKKGDTDKYIDRRWKELSELAKKIIKIKGIPQKMKKFFRDFKKENKKRILWKFKRLKAPQVKEFDYEWVWNHFISIKDKEQIEKELSIDDSEIIKEWEFISYKNQKAIMPFLEKFFEKDQIGYFLTYNSFKEGERKTENEKYLNTLRRETRKGGWFDFMTKKEQERFLKLNKQYFIEDNLETSEKIKDLFRKIKNDNRITSSELEAFLENYNFRGNLDQIKELIGEEPEEAKNVDWINFKKRLNKEDWFLKGEIIKITDLSEVLWINFEEKIINKILSLSKDEFNSLSKRDIPDSFDIKSLIIDLPIDKKIMFEKPFKIRLSKKVKYYISKINKIKNSYQAKENKRVFWGKEFTKGFKKAVRRKIE